MEQYLTILQQLQDILMYRGYWDTIVNIWNQIMTVILIAGMVFAILNCFWGYQLMRLWMSLIGLVIGAIIGAILGLRFFDSRNMIFIAAVVCGLLAAMLVNLIYRLGIVILCAGIVFFTFELLFPVAAFGVHMGFLAVGIAAGLAAFAYEDLVVSWVTGICGGLLFGRTLFLLLGIENIYIALVVGALAAALGVRVQYRRLKRDPDVKKRQKKLQEKRGE